LNLPDFRYGTLGDENLKGVYLDKLYPYSIGALNNLNTSLKWHMQSYVMNYEVAILNGFSLDSGKYDSEILRTPSERIFFNWLQKVDAIKFNGNRETLYGYGDDVDIAYETLNGEYELEGLEGEEKTKSYRIGNKLYVWKGGEWRSRVLVSKTVQYIGTIDMVNNVNIDYDSFNEIYLNIPSGVGGSTDVYFDNNVFDSNYERGEVINVENDEYCENPLYIIGRDPDKLNLSGDDVITLNAIYDLEDGSDSDSEFDSLHNYEIDNGYCINFNDSKYSGGIEGMNLDSEEDFEFNCVLIYYRIRRGNGEWYTNLYGVLFLEEICESDYNTSNNADGERGGYIQRYPKFKKGNSWGLKLDLKIDAQPDSQMELRDKEYTDPNEGTGMQMFTEALMQLNDCAKLFYDVKKQNTSIEERLYELENIMYGVDTVYELRGEVNELRTKVEMFQPTLDSLGGRMDDVESRIEKLEKNLGYLIRDLKSTNVDMSDRFSILENELKNLKSSN
jgi:uncharacterized coiled-coil protein SlyX